MVKTCIAPRSGRIGRNRRRCVSSVARISGNGEGMICWRTASGALRSPPVCPTLNVRSTRFFPTIHRTQRRSVVKRLAKPLRNARCTNAHTTHAGNPLMRIPRQLKMARKRPMVATLPRSR